MEMHNRWRDIMREVTSNLQHTTSQAHHRVQGHTGNKAKTSAKKKSSSSGGGSGGDGGDGDGPHQNRSQQKNRSSSNRNNGSQRPPRIPPGAIATTSSPQFPPRRSSIGRDIALILVIVCLFGMFVISQELYLRVLVIPCMLIMGLVLAGHPKVAMYVWSSILKLLKQLSESTSDES
jgi:hypothetical protein